MNQTYHDMVDAAYRGQGYNFHGPGWVVRAPALRNQPKYLEPLVTCPSYHFGSLLAGWSDRFPDDINQPPAERILEYMNEMGQKRLALVYDTEKHPSTVVVTFNDVGGALAVAICCYDQTGKLSVEPNRWLAFTDAFAQSKASWGFIWVAAVGLEMLANPSVQFVMRQPSGAMETFSKNKVRRGEEPVGDMKIVHLTKRIVIGGTSYGGHGGSQSEKSPHDRQGHWRHSEREIAGWEKVKPERGQYAGITMWRKWIDAFPVKGGKVARQSGQFADNAAPQFRVVR